MIDRALTIAFLIAALCTSGGWLVIQLHRVHKRPKETRQPEPAEQDDPDWNPDLPTWDRDMTYINPEFLDIYDRLGRRFNRRMNRLIERVEEKAQ